MSHRAAGVRVVDANGGLFVVERTVRRDHDSSALQIGYAYPDGTV